MNFKGGAGDGDGFMAWSSQQGTRESSLYGHRV